MGTVTPHAGEEVKPQDLREEAERCLKNALLEISRGALDVAKSDAQQALRYLDFQPGDRFLTRSPAVPFQPDGSESLTVQEILSEMQVRIEFNQGIGVAPPSMVQMIEWIEDRVQESGAGRGAGEVVEARQTTRRYTLMEKARGTATETRARQLVGLTKPNEIIRAIPFTTIEAEADGK